MRQGSKLNVTKLWVNEKEQRFKKLLLVDNKSCYHLAYVTSDECFTVGHQCCLMIAIAVVVTK